MTLLPFLMNVLSILFIVIFLLLIVAAIRKLRGIPKDDHQMAPAEEKRWLVYRSAVLPLLFILPFFVNHFYTFPCPNPESFAGPCYIIGSGFSGWLGFFAVIFGVAMLFSVKATWKRGKNRAQFAKRQLYFALASVMITIVVYSIMYQFSQGKYLGLLEGFSPPSAETVAEVKDHPFGVSYPPVFLAVFSLIYLLAPVSQWWNMTRDKARVAGIKKGELFK